MTSASSPTSLHSLQILKIALYVLAGLILIPGAITGISLMTSVDYIVANAITPLQLMGIGGLSNLIASMLTPFLINIGAIILILSLVFSALLFAVARLIGRIAQLEARLAILESKP